jgi:hypothetical protein
MPFYTNLWSSACNYNKRKNVEPNHDVFDDSHEDQYTNGNYREGFGIGDVMGGDSSGATGTSDSSGATGATGTSDSSGATGATGPIGASAPPAPLIGGPNILSSLFSGSTGTTALFTSLGLPGLNNIIAPSGIPGVPGTETDATVSKEQTALSNQIFIYVIHILVSIVLTYLWGVFGANALFLVTLSQDEKDYIFPTKPYNLPYCDEKDTSKCLFDYGFPYDLSPRMCNSNEQVLHLIEKEEKNINILTAFKDGGSGDGVSDALFNYIFNSVYGGVGRGGRGATKMLLNLFSPSDSTTPKNKESWSTEMKFSPIRRVLIFLIIPIVFVYALIPIMGLVSGIMGAIFGILNNHPFWGMFFSLIFGIFIFIGNGIWTSLQTVYFFGYYPCAIVETKKQDRYNDIFESVKPYLLNIFYCFMVYFAFLDLGSGIGGGIMFIALVAALTGFV